MPGRGVERLPVTGPTGMRIAVLQSTFAASRRSRRDGSGGDQRADVTDERPEYHRHRERRDQGPGRVDHGRGADDRVQDSYVHTLARKAGEEVPDEMTKAEASMKIDELREKTGVGEAPKKRKARKA